MALINKSNQIRRVRYLPTVGSVSLGTKVKNKEGKEHPQSAGHFVFKTKDDIWQQVIMECYGDKPTRLFITIPASEMSDYVHNVYQLRRNNEILAETDDENLWKISNGQYVKSDDVNIEKVGGIQNAKALMAEKSGGEWKEALMFQFFILPTKWIPDENRFEMPFQNTVLPLGVFRLYTHGKESIDNILSTLGMDRISGYFALDYDMKKTKKGIFPVLRLTPVIAGNMGSNLLLNTGSERPAAALPARSEEYEETGEDFEIEDI